MLFILKIAELNFQGVTLPLLPPGPGDISLHGGDHPPELLVGDG